MNKKTDHSDTSRIKIIGLICERITKGHRIEVRVSKSSVEIKNTAYTPVLFLILLAVHLMKYCCAI